MCVDCATCGEWFQNQTAPIFTNFCGNSDDVLYDLGACACSISCGTECASSTLCGESGNFSPGCLNCMQATCAQQYNACMNDTFP
jgi:hypothetical protein